MKQRKILMCLGGLDIGGVETAVITLCKGYLRAGHKVFVAAKSGIYKDELEKLGVEVLDIDYAIDNHVHLEKKEELKKYCLERKITEVHIHQYPCIMYWLPVCMELNIPYVAYSHSIVPTAIAWFTKTFTCYDKMIPLFYTYASKIVCIAESTKKEIEDNYHFGDARYLVIPNSLNMEDFKITRKPAEIKVFGIAARFAKEKVLPIKKGIDLFNEYNKIHKNCKLLIAGDGPEKETIKQYIAENKLKDNVTLLGSISDMVSFYNKIDVFIGVDRCILESLACKRLSIISSYTGTMNIVDSSTIEKASKQNFSGQNLEDDQEVLTKLLNMKEKDYQKITKANYDFINKKYNVDNNLYTAELTTNYPKDYNVIFEKLNKEASSPLRKLYNFLKRVLRKIKSLLIKK